MAKGGWRKVGGQEWVTDSRTQGVGQVGQVAEREGRGQVVCAGMNNNPVHGNEGGHGVQREIEHEA